VVIEEPQDGGDLVFEALHDKSWTVRATIDNFKMGVDVGYACVFLDGLYKGCSVDANLVLVFDDPGLDYTWHLLEVRLLDAQDQQVAPSVLAEFRAGVRPCSVPITEHITSLVAQGLAWQHQVMGTSSDITCVSSLREALHSSVHMTVTPEPEEEEEESYLAHATLWADEESLAAVMPFANYRRWRTSRLREETVCFTIYAGRAPTGTSLLLSLPGPECLTENWRGPLWSSKSGVTRFIIG